MSSPIEVASLFATLRLEDQLTGALGGVGRGLDGLGARIERAGGRISAFGGAIDTAIAPLVNFGRQGIGVAADFETAMAEISARTGLVGDDMQRIQDYALQMGQQTSFSAQEAANAFLQLLSSGQTAEEAIATLPAVLAAAAASGGDLGTTADAITDILNMFGLSALEAGSAADSLARASGASSATMTDLIAGFQNVGGIAATFGMDVNDVAAALATLSENGIKGAEAGTALKRMLMNFGSETAIAAFDELGVSLYDAQGNIRDMNTVLTELGTSLDGLPDQDVTRLVDALGGIGGSPALLALGEGFSGMETDMAGAADAATIAEGRMDTFAGAMDTLSGSVETLQIKVLTPFMENTLAPLAEKLTEIVTNLTSWAEENPELADTVTKVVFGLALFTGVLIPLGALIAAGGAIVTGVTAFAGALSAVSVNAGLIAGPMMAAIGPIILVGAAIAGVIAQINEFNRLIGAGAAAAGQAAIESGADQLAIDWAAWQATESNGVLAGIGLSPHFAASTAANAGMTYDWDAGWANRALFQQGLTPEDILGQRASGGPVSAGMPYLVGEAGPEILVPSGNGRVIPNHDLGGQTINVYVNNYGSTPYEFADTVTRALRERGF